MRLSALQFPLYYYYSASSLPSFFVIMASATRQVLVTGASGFVAGHIVDQLLSKGTEDDCKSSLLSLFLSLLSSFVLGLSCKCLSFCVSVSFPMERIEENSEKHQ